MKYYFFFLFLPKNTHYIHCVCVFLIPMSRTPTKKKRRKKKFKRKKNAKILFGCLFLPKKKIIKWQWQSYSYSIHIYFHTLTRTHTKQYHVSCKTNETQVFVCLLSFLFLSQLSYRLHRSHVKRALNRDTQTETKQPRARARAHTNTFRSQCVSHYKVKLNRNSNNM